MMEKGIKFIAKLSTEEKRTIVERTGFSFKEIEEMINFDGRQKSSRDL